MDHSQAILPTRSLGKTGLMVTILGFGGIPIQLVSEEQAIATVRRAHELGVTFFDTARAYTNSEERIGKALEGRKYIVATKTGARDAEGAYADVLRSLENLRREQIDLYQVHGVNDDGELERVLSAGGALEGLRRAHQEKKIAHIGITGHRRETLIKAVQICAEFETVQVPFNVVEDDIIDTLLAECSRRNIGTIAMKPVGGGNFSNAPLAVKWCLNQPITTAIPGMASPTEVEEDVAVGVGDIQLTPVEREQCEQMKEELGPRICRRCGYCQPCPNGVNIFLLLNGTGIIRRMGVERYREWGAEQAIAGAENCQECEICVGKCPYNLPIPELIREALAYYKTVPGLK
ncbi:MAG: aldo/keto reductase [Armatimonadetes bacterium]|nr:aldo/keto reductase [Armatimonadota bacterium]NIM23109.1 aldo/keto reductase [Armatimonadota bacterium]NIM66977.1 aldo/keto reductase [Armatimonadota bacterium]NIM75511.1 aldo/keto reductase [Armatimonadota bacterium]NIN05166.1 aldo/keto reductase [Armatimonadota bacterium]